MILKLYPEMRRRVISIQEYYDDVIWQNKASLDSTSGPYFLNQLAHVVLSSGMKASVISTIWYNFARVFHNFQSPQDIVEKKERMRIDALKLFNSQGKVDAIIKAAEIIYSEGWDVIKGTLESKGIDYLEKFPYIGKITKYHLAKNIGFDVAKPDRHLVRIAKYFKYESVQMMCKYISENYEPRSAEMKDRIATVDYVLWRYTEMNMVFQLMMREMDDLEV